jgi:hypothetical protein
MACHPVRRVIVEAGFHGTSRHLQGLTTDGDLQSLPVQHRLLADQALDFPDDFLLEGFRKALFLAS